MRQRLRWLLVLLLITHCFRLAHAIPNLAPESRPDFLPANQLSIQMIRVKLSDLGRVLVFKGTDLTASFNHHNIKSSEWVVDCKRSLLIDPSTGKGRDIPAQGVAIESASRLLSLNSRFFREKFLVYPNQEACLVINYLPLENYLESVVNGEFNSKWAQSAVEAQIIAARTYAIYQMNERRKNKKNHFDVESTQADQVYLGLERVDSLATQLVTKTKGLILVAKNSTLMKPIKAFYSAICGGKTLLPQHVWGQKFAGFTQKASCPYCSGAPSYAWNYSSNLVEVEKRIRPSKYQNWRLISLKLIKGQENRNQSIVFTFQDSRAQEKRQVQTKMDAYEFRNRMDPTRLKSTLFDFSIRGDEIVFKGKGSGHAVGLCQWGAKKMGETGFTREQILSHYYPGVKITQIRANELF